MLEIVFLSDRAPIRIEGNNWGVLVDYAEARLDRFPWFRLRQGGSERLLAQLQLRDPERFFGLVGEPYETPYELTTRLFDVLAAHGALAPLVFDFRDACIHRLPPEPL